MNKEFLFELLRTGSVGGNEAELEKKIYVVGIGPGDGDGMTVRSRKVIEGCDVVIGYTTYVDLLKPLFPDKEFMATGMRQEIERCKLCFELVKA